MNWGNLTTAMQQRATTFSAYCAMALCDYRAELIVSSFVTLHWQYWCQLCCDCCCCVPAGCPKHITVTRTCTVTCPSVVLWNAYSTRIEVFFSWYLVYSCWCCGGNCQDMCCYVWQQLVKHCRWPCCQGVIWVVNMVKWHKFVGK